MQTPTLPFKLLVLAPFGLQLEGKSHECIRVDKMNLDQVIEDLGLSIHVPLPKNLCQSEGLVFNFERLKDFNPDRLLETNPFLKNLLEAKEFIREANLKGLSQAVIDERLKAWPDLPPEARLSYQRPRGAAAPSSTSPIDNILEMISMPEGGSASSVETESSIAPVDSVIQQILNHLFSYEPYRNLESTWRGLKFLIDHGGVDGEVTVEIAAVSPETLEDTLDFLMPDLIQDLPSAVILDLPFDNSPRSLELLEKVALFSENLLVPTLCWITPKFLFLDNWQGLDKLPFLSHYLEESAFAKWRRLRATPSARWVTITCNRFLIRYPYGPDNKPKSVHFEESQRLWASPVWALGSLLGQSLVKTGWPTRFTEWQQVRLEGLALNRAEGSKSIPTETHLSNERIDQFIKGGITPLISIVNKDIAFMPMETTMAGNSLSYQLFLSRISQFLFWCKDHLEKDLEPAVLEDSLKKAFSLFWERSGHLLPKSFEISVSRPKLEQPAKVKIGIEPSRQILPTGEKIEIELNW